MANISYNVVLPQNLALKRLPLQQIEVILDITGAQVDPLTLQQIRDEDSIKQCFLARRTNINSLIQNTANALAKIKSDKEGEAAVNEFNKKLESEINTLKTELQNRCNAFIVKQKKNVNDLFWAQAKMVVRVVYALAKYVKSGMEISGKVAVAVTAGMNPLGVFLSVVAIKQLISTVNDSNAANAELMEAIEEERTTYVKLRDAIKELKKFKKPEKVLQTKIDAVSNLVGPYGARLLGVDTAAKKSATKLDHLLKDLDKGTFRNQAAQKQMEDRVDELIHSIIERSKNVAEGRRLLQAAKDKVNEANTRAKKDPISFWDVAANLWKAFDLLVDCGSEALEKKDYMAAGEQLLVKLNEEQRDALIAEKTQL